MTRVDLNADALAAKRLTQVRDLTRWVGTGRKLTQTGRLTMADARELVSLLDTSDAIDPVIGGKVFRTTTSEDLAGLTTVLAWAKVIGMVRVQSGRLVAVKKHAPLLSRPMDMWASMFEAFDRLGDAVCPRNWFSSLLGDDFADGVATLFGGIAERGGAIYVDDAADLIWNTLVVRYRTDNVAEDQLRRWRQANDIDLRRTVDELVGLGALAEDDTRTLRLTRLAEWTLRRPFGADKPGEPIAQISVTLLDTDPPIWRRILVPAKIRLDRLHHVIQAAMGWEDYHLHMFTHGADRYGVPDPDFPDRDERTAALFDLASREGDSIGYEYDFGDSWEHEIVVEAVTAAEPDGQYPICLIGERACPPEDCGGTPGYDELINTLADTGHPDHEHMRQWLGLADTTAFDPGRFDLDEVNARIDTTVRARHR